MPETTLEIETLLSLAALESHARLSDIQALQAVAFVWSDAAGWCVQAARFVIGAGDAPEARASDVPLERAINTILNLIAGSGLRTSTTGELINVTNVLLSKLEDTRRAKQHLIVLELASFALVEAVKAVMFGRNLNIAERSQLRGLYGRERLLQQV
jgi:hypothetical protein